MTKKILIIDDDRGSVKLIQSHLERSGFETAEAFDGREGLEMVEKAQPDLIILDVEMPRTNGYSFMMQLKDKEKFQSIPVIVLTAHADKQPIFQLKGVKHYLLKPLNIDEMMEKIDDCLFKKIEKFEEHIMIIESNSTQKKLMKYNLSTAGFERLTFLETGKEGVERAKSDNPDVVVINAVLSDMTGYEACRMIKETEGLNLKIILLVEKQENVDENKLKESGSDHCAVKSAKYENLVDGIKKMLKNTDV